MSSNFFTVIPQFKPQPHYELWVELPAGVASDGLLTHLAKTTDEKLQHINIEYKAKRDSGRLEVIEARLLAPGTYEQLRKHLCTQHVADSQIKVSHLNPKPEVRDFLSQKLEVGGGTTAFSKTLSSITDDR
jgi:hypothetical protein